MDDLFKSDDTAAPDEQAVRRFAIAMLNALEGREKIELHGAVPVRVPGGFMIRRSNVTR
jgi:hypothetical protein